VKLATEVVAFSPGGMNSKQRVEPGESGKTACAVVEKVHVSSTQESKEETETGILLQDPIDSACCSEKRRRNRTK
jgi:hypothetical protein